MGKTFMRRPGNKTSHLKHILPMIPKFTGTYYEPFVGTGAVFLSLKPEKWVINDLNKYIYGIWKAVKNDPALLITRVREFKHVFLKLGAHKRMGYLKSVVSKGLDPIGYLMVNYCSIDGSIEKHDGLKVTGIYGDIHRYNTCHLFTDAYTSKINTYSMMLSKGKITNKDYSDVLLECKKGDFVFLDPPYIEDTPYKFKYINEAFDIKKLLNEVKKLDKKNVKWMMTQVYTDDVKSLFKDYRFTEYINKGKITGSASKVEVIITNY